MCRYLQFPLSRRDPPDLSSPGSSLCARGPGTPNAQASLTAGAHPSPAGLAQLSQEKSCRNPAVSIQQHEGCSSHDLKPANWGRHGEGKPGQTLPPGSRSDSRAPATPQSCCSDSELRAGLRAPELRWATNLFALCSSTSSHPASSSLSQPPSDAGTGKPNQTSLQSQSITLKTVPHP